MGQAGAVGAVVGVGRGVTVGAAVLVVITVAVGVGEGVGVGLPAESSAGNCPGEIGASGLDADGLQCA